MTPIGPTLAALVAALKPPLPGGEGAGGEGRSAAALKPKLSTRPPRKPMRIRGKP
jgi:hypothetical protein